MTDEQSARAASEALPVHAGDLIHGKYLVEEVIGFGGVGVVFAAKNVEMDERVALKFLRPEMREQRDIVARFMVEAKAACTIKSEYVAHVYDVGTLESGDPFFVMEYLEGSDLEGVIRERGRIGRREATEYAMQACEALAIAHAAGIVHRDIKPANLFLSSRAGMSSIKVLDFGVSKAALAGSIFKSPIPRLATMNLMGSPLYMSPEQVRSAASADSRSDIWALGLVLYEMLTGTAPFQGHTLNEICAAILEKAPTPLGGHGVEVPPGYAEVLARCLAKDPAARYQNVADLAAALMPFAPRRARICAERAARALANAGLIEPTSVRLSTIPPPSESSIASAALALPPPPPPPTEMGTGPLSLTPMQRSVPPADFRPPARPTNVLALGVVAAALTATLAFVLFTLPAEAPTPSAAVAPPPATTIPPRVVPATATATARGAATEVPITTPSAAASRPRPEPTDAAQRGRSRRPKSDAVDARTPPPPPPASAERATAPSCTPPFYFEGTKKVFKPECI